VLTTCSLLDVFKKHKQDGDEQGWRKGFVAMYSANEVFFEVSQLL